VCLYEGLYSYSVRENEAISANMLNFKILFIVFLFGGKLEEAGIITFA